MEARPAGEVTQLLERMRAGDSDATNQLIPSLVDELRNLARLQLRSDRPGHTLQPTALVNEVYLRLVSDQARDWRGRAHFIGVAVLVMKRILIDYARRKRAFKRGGVEPLATDAQEYAGRRRVSSKCVQARCQFAEHESKRKNIAGRRK